MNITKTTGKNRIIFKTLKDHLIDVIKENGWDWKASGGAKIMEHLLK